MDRRNITDKRKLIFAFRNFGIKPNNLSWFLSCVGFCEIHTTVTNHQFRIISRKTGMVVSLRPYISFLFQKLTSSKLPKNALILDETSLFIAILTASAIHILSTFFQVF
jgi:hypothetical protein